MLGYFVLLPETEIWGPKWEFQRKSVCKCFFSTWDLHLSACYGLKPMPVTTGNLSNPIVAVCCSFVMRFCTVHYFRTMASSGLSFWGIFPNS